jgi:hypothetical protein
LPLELPPRPSLRRLKQHSQQPKRQAHSANRRLRNYSQNDHVHVDLVASPVWAVGEMSIPEVY